MFNALSKRLIVFSKHYTKEGKKGTIHELFAQSDKLCNLLKQRLLNGCKFSEIAARFEKKSTRG